MVIDRLIIHNITLPFTGDFSHSIRQGFFAKNIVIEVIANHGMINGYGEGAPRSYVTGETQESVANSVEALIMKNTFPWRVNDVSEIWDFIDNLPNDKKNNAAICAIEMSLIAALALEQNKNILDYFPHHHKIDKIDYGGGIPLVPIERIIELCRVFQELRIKKMKIKMGKNFKQNSDIIHTVKKIFGDDCDLKIDVNGVWDKKMALKHMPIIKKYNVSVVEQPMMPDDPDISEFSRIAERNGIILMADESACSLEDVKRLSEKAYYKMINVRLSKCGGFRRALKIIDYLREKDLFFQIACHLGESGILSAAGRALSLLCGDAMYYDGSYDDILLKENITTENVSFGVGGEAGPLDSPGLGVEVDKEYLKRLSNQHSKMTIMPP